MKRCLSILCALGALCGSELNGAEKLNVLLLLVDDLKPALGCYGDPVARTPHIDALAARGMRFDLAYCNQAVCAPSRFTLMLGSHSTSTGLYGLGSKLRQVLPNAVTMPQHFARHGGYRTESLGKVFHIGHGNEGDPESFSVPHFHDKVIEYADPASIPGGQLTREESYFTNRKLGQIRSLPRGAAFESPDVDDSAYADGRVADETVKRLRAAKKRLEENKTPFFITAGFARPHLPFSAPQKYWDLYDPEKLPLPEFEEFPANSPAVAHKRGGEICNYFPVPDHDDYRAGKEISPELKRELIHGYYASTSYVDAQVGKVTAELDRLGLAEETIVVLWGDHGFHLGDLGIWTKHTNYEQANRIPILIAAPGTTKPGSSTRQPAESVDIFPTLAELAGLPEPDGPQPIDGVSLVPVLKDPEARVRDHAFHAYPKSKMGRAIRTERFRLVEWKRPGASRESAELELYDYQEDPLETKNLAKERPAAVKRLRVILDQYPEAVGRDGKPVQARIADSGGGASATPRKKVSPQIARQELRIITEVKSRKADEVPRGVVLAQGGVEHGYAVHFLPGGRPAFDVRVNGKVTRICGKEPVKGGARLEATLGAETMTLSLDGKIVARAKSPGLIPVQPKDPLSVAMDTLTGAGDYDAPNSFNGTVLNVRVEAGGEPFVISDPAPGGQDGTGSRPAMLTEWGEGVTPENAWTEYPRPALQRPDWTNLNGLWNYSVAPASSKQPGEWSGKILVPFALEAPLSGVERLLEPDEALWYEREFEVQAAASGRLLLHFEAVDYHATVWVNGEQVGENTGGNLPFSFDITEQVKAGANTLRLKVVDRTNAPGSYQLTGKQRLRNRGIFYTRVSGIWQTVWMEPVPANHIRDLKIRTALDGTILITPDIAGEGALRTKVFLQGRKVAEGGEKVTVPDPKFWSPGSPTLYELVVSLTDPRGVVLDTVKSYAGIREVGKVKDDDGQWRFTLNGKPIFHWGPLDQGWWPDGLLTPPSEEAMLFELDYLKKAGFNMIRKHIKIEPRRYYHHCDRMGFLVWQDQVSGGPKPKWYRLDPAGNKGHDVPEPGDPIDAEWPEAGHRQWMSELKGMIDHLGSHPSIVSWVPFNEAWGQHRTKEVGRWIVGYDPSRLINIASGGNFAPVGDIADMHSYPEPTFPFHIPAYNDYVKVVGEFGGHGWAVDGHQWDPNKKTFIYGDMPRSLGEYRARYEASIRALAELKRQGVAGGVYTQTTDVEGEINGLLTYDRKVRKIPPAQLAEIHRKAGLID